MRQLLAMDSASVGERLPDEIAMAILLKLPVKSLIRFRCLSKSISAAVRSSKFIDRHHALQRQNSSPRILVNVLPRDYHGDEPHLTAISGELLRTENIRIPFAHNSPFYPDVVISPCNGLICLADNHRIAIWNPATRQLKYIPPSPIPRPPDSDVGPVNLGFDSRSKEYKVIVSILNYDRDEEGWTDQVELYSLTTNSWREIPITNLIFLPTPTFFDQKNDEVLWLGSGFYENVYRKLILSFNMRNEFFSKIVLPEFEGVQQLVFVEHPGADIALIAYPFHQEKFFELWVKKQGWTREWRIGPFDRIQHSLGLWKFGQMLLESDDNELLLLNVESGEMKNLGVFETGDDCMHIVVYVESLVPILGCTGHQETVVHQMILL